MGFVDEDSHDFWEAVGGPGYLEYFNARDNDQDNEPNAMQLSKPVETRSVLDLLPVPVAPVRVTGLPRITPSPSSSPTSMTRGTMADEELGMSSTCSTSHLQLPRS